ncbi:MAG: siphovirus ReqiPepy6 Gp37-like family protein [Clostridia bacterium]|nr:siphovirus ReqiPepy6 Gp37-like family protein [Clostridia bacterium]
MIRVFDINLNLLAEVDDYESLVFTRDYYTHGTFEIVMNAEKENAKYLKKNNIILLGKSKHKCGIIKSVEIVSEESEVATVTGFTLDYLLINRIIKPPTGEMFDSVTGPVESCMKHYIDVSMINPVDPNRKISIFSLAADQLRGENAVYNARGENLEEFISAMRSEREIGLRTYIDTVNKKIEMDILIGQDKTMSSSNPVIFSTEYDNLINQSFFQTDVDERNFAYVLGQGDGIDRLLLEVGDTSDMDRKEILIEANVETENLESHALTELSKYKEVITFEAEVINRSPFKYEEDFNIGDIVTINNKRWGLRLDARITQITEIYEAENHAIEVVFGNNIPTLKSIVNKKTKKEVR